MKRIYVVEDHDAIRDSVVHYLTLSGFNATGYPLLRDAQVAINKSKPDLLVQDVMMPDGDGFTFVKQLRLQYGFPVVFMTARASESDRIMGFELGGDDYVVKPFSPKELVLRIEAIFRRIDKPLQDQRQGSCWELDGSILRFDNLAHIFTIDNEHVQLTAAEWRIVACLIDNGGNLVTRQQMLESCFGYSFESYDRIIDTHIKNIRAKVGDNGGAWIETIRGYGYRFAGRRCLDEQ
ncbi:MAG: response regulator transcription factor [Sphaerochaetaceae bacterium]|nr:response regulator transcription factor [Sphaerochaetaceae bacterium]